MPLPIVLVAFGERRYLDEALAGIDWHRRHGLTNPIELWVDPAFGSVSADAQIRTLERVRTGSPSFVQGWYYKTLLLREKCRGEGPFCLLDAYARVLRPDLFDQMEGMLRQFPVCLSLDPRRTLSVELALGRGISPEVVREMSDVPGTFPLWNTGVVFAAPSPSSQTLADRLEEICRTYLDRGWMIREQIALVKAAMETSIAPFTLPDNYNVRRPFLDPAIVLHTRRYGHFYGVAEVDTERSRFERVRHEIKAAAVRSFRLRGFLGGS